MRGQGFQETSLKHFHAQAQKSLQKASWTHFEAFPGPGSKVAPGGFQETILKHFQAQVQKSVQEVPWRSTQISPNQARFNPNQSRFNEQLTDRVPTEHMLCFLTLWWTYCAAALEPYQLFPRCRNCTILHIALLPWSPISSSHAEEI